MKKIRLLSMFICFLFIAQLIFTPVYASQTQEIEMETYGCHSIDAEVSVLGNGERIKNVQSVFLYETKSQTLMYDWNADVSADPASLVKIMTALIAIENGKLDDIVTIDAAVLEQLPEYVATVDLVDGEIVTVEELLYCLLVSSGNDAALILADYISQDQSAFVSLMNEKAQEIGCTATNFTNCTGLYEETQVSTARDIARILNYALNNEVFREIFCTAEYDMQATNKSEKRYLATGNYLMPDNQDMVTYYIDYRVRGGRTGISNDGLRSVVALSEDSNMELISIVMGSESEYADNGYSTTTFGGYQETTALLDLGFSGMKVAQILFANQALTQQSVSGGESDVVLCPRESVYAVLPQNAKVDSLNYRFTYNEQDISAPVEKDVQLGTVEVWSGSICVGKAALYSMNQVQVLEDTTANTNQSNGFWNSVGSVLLKILFVAFGLFAALYIYRRIRMYMIRKRRKKNIRARRRSK